MKSNNVYAYKNVFRREDVKQFEFEDFLEDPGVIFEAFDVENYVDRCNKIKEIEDKQIRNELKRDFLPAVDISPSSILSIDIDGISGNDMVKSSIISKLKLNPMAYAVQESISGNIVAFFRYECTVEEFPYLYYKLYLELVLSLSVNIDFLPEIGRLRYLSLGEVYHINRDSQTVYETLVVDELPYISTNTNKKTARSVIYKSV